MWGSPVPANVKEAGALIERPPAAFDATPALAAFVAELLREFPSLTDDPKRSPWSVMPVPTERFLELDLSSGAKDSDVLRMFALASEHGLVVYDPEGPALYPPDTSGPTVA
ncbi:MAG: hypothetical protein ACRDF9_08290 [Candidatus Limnocylindria bacterium]